MKKAIPVRISGILALVLALTGGVVRQVAAQNIADGKDLYEVCASCHGKLGEGGKKGEYPRLAGQKAAYLANQLRAFKSRRRINIPMFPYTQERELSEGDIRDVAAFLATIRLPTKMPTFRGDEDALTRLRMVENVMIIPRVEGDIDNGGRIYREECAFCHGKTGLGGGKYPMLVGQYTQYLKKQMDAYVRGERPHDEEDSRGILAELKPSDLQDLLAYLTSIQEQQ